MMPTVVASSFWWREKEIASGREREFIFIKGILVIALPFIFLPTCVSLKNQHSFLVKK